MDELKLWDGESEITGPVICFLKDEEWLKLWVLDKNPDDKINVFFVNDSLESNLYTISSYICHKYGFKHSVIPDSDEEVLFKVWRNILLGRTCEKYLPCKTPSLFYKADGLIDNLESMNVIRLRMLISSPWVDCKGVYFDRAWWKNRPNIEGDVTKLKSKILKLSKLNYIYSNMFEWINNLSKSIHELHQGSLESILLSSSAFFFAAAKFARTENEVNKSLLLLHRCIDLYFQYVCCNLRLVTASNNRDVGLIYTGKDNKKDVTLDRSKNKLIDGQYIYVDGEVIKKIDRINFIRNRNFLTHSLYGISELEIDGYLSTGYNFIQTMEGDNAKWKKKVRGYLNKPNVSEIDIFNNEISFDAFIQEEVIG